MNNDEGNRDNVLSLVDKAPPKEEEPENPSFQDLVDMLTEHTKVEEAVILCLDENGHLRIASNMKSAAHVNLFLDTAKLSLMTSMEDQ